ncbi:hypothetical protein CC80DRAFT_510454 [Byssothecium circinans]|uniref:Uncharacterized protein n=1 Tax=Byssothecium circinans TaxID=147558 RepID=A0A6A5TFG3_9PLEO|nr:hypothetical protein CC80DRAFT_510454 [Byssothecium circinans]
MQVKEVIPFYNCNGPYYHLSSHLPPQPTPALLRITTSTLSGMNTSDNHEPRPMAPLIAAKWDQYDALLATINNNLALVEKYAKATPQKIKQGDNSTAFIHPMVRNEQLQAYWQGNDHVKEVRSQLRGNQDVMKMREDGISPERCLLSATEREFPESPFDVLRKVDREVEERLEGLRQHFTSEEKRQIESQG